MHWIGTYLRDDLYISIAVKFSCVHHGSKSETYMRSHWKCTYLFQSFCWSCMFDCTTHKAVYIYVLLPWEYVNSMCRNFFFVFLCLERMSWTAFLLTPFPKHHMKYAVLLRTNRITSGPLLNWPLELPHGLSLISLENLCPQP